MYVRIYLSGAKGNIFLLWKKTVESVLKNKKSVTKKGKFAIHKKQNVTKYYFFFEYFLFFCEYLL